MQTGRMEQLSLKIGESRLQYLKSLFRGVSYPILSVSCTTGVVFFAYRGVLEVMASRSGAPLTSDSKPPLTHVFVAGTVSGW